MDFLDAVDEIKKGYWVRRKEWETHRYIGSLEANPDLESACDLWTPEIKDVEREAIDWESYSSNLIKFKDLNLATDEIFYYISNKKNAIIGYMGQTVLDDNFLCRTIKKEKE